MVDVPLVFNKTKREFIESIPAHPQRRIIRCGKAHKNFGNTCRRNGCKLAQGDYILYLDDDDTYADEQVLETLKEVTAAWAIFPCSRVGVYWLFEPPGIDKTGSAMFTHRRDTGVMYHDPEEPGYHEYMKTVQDGKFYEQLIVDYPQIVEQRFGWIRYAADGLTVEELKSKFPYQVIRSRPLTIYACANKGRE